MTSACSKLQVLSKIGTRCISSVGTPDHSCKLLVLGGGAGGCATAAKFAKRLGKGNVIIVEPSDVHYYQPLFTLVGGGLKKLPQSFRPMSKVLPKKATWIKDSVSRIHPHQNCVTTAGGLNISYEYLVVALGIELRFDMIKGLPEALAEPESGVSSNYSPKYVERTFANVSRLKEGNAVFTFPNTPIKCAGAPVKACFITDYCVRKAGHRSDVNIFYRSAMPFIFSVKKYADELMRLAEIRDINVKLRQELVEVNHESREATFKDLENPQNTETIQFTMLHAVPPMRPPRLLAESSPDLVDPAGYLKLNKLTLRHETFPNIFGIGDCSNLPTSKTGAAVAGQLGVLSKNLKRTFEGKELAPIYDGYTACPLVTGDGTCIMAEFDYDLKPRETFSFMDQGKEHYSMFIMKKEIFPFIYWHGMMNGYWNGPGIFRKLLHMDFSK